MAGGHNDEEEDDDDEDEEDDQFPPHGHDDAATTSSSRFSRYIRFAQKRRRSQRDPNRSASAPRTSESRAGTSALPAPYTDY